MIRIHQKCNELLIKELRQGQLLNIDCKNKVTDNLTDNVNNKAFIKNSIAWEKENQKNGSPSFPLYRGKPTHSKDWGELQDTVYLPNKDGRHSHDYSFGQSLFANHPSLGDCSAFYGSRSDEIYVLPVDKYNFLYGNLGNFFHIPPLMKIVTLLVGTPFTHVKTTIPCNTFDEKQTLQNLSTTRLYENFKVTLPTYLLQFFKDKEECTQNLKDRTKYIRNNLVPLTKKTEKSLSKKLGRLLKTPLQQKSSLSNEL
jgi:hypothetical protein